MNTNQPSKNESAILQVFIFREGRFWGTECFSQPQITLGRSPEVDLQLDDDVISRSHASVLVSNDGLVLEDLGSSNGTFVNGETVERCFIDTRDEVSIGAFTLKFKLLGKKKAEHAHGETRLAAKERVRNDETEIIQASDVAPQLHARPEESEQEDNPAFIIDDTIRSPKDEQLLEKVRPSFREEQQALSDDESPQDDGTRSSEDSGYQPDESELPTFSTSDQKVVQQVRKGSRDLESSRSFPSEPKPSSSRQKDLAIPSFEISEQLAALAPDLGDEPVPEPVLDRGAESFEEEDDEEEDQDERNFVEPFSLLNNLVRENFTQLPVATQPTFVLEVIAYSPEKKVLGYEQIPQGGRYSLGANQFLLVDYHHGECQLRFDDTFSGGVILGGRTVPIQELKGMASQQKRRGQMAYAYNISKGDYANLLHEGGGSFLRFVNPPQLPPVKQFQVERTFLKSLGSSFALHVLVMVVMGLFFWKGVEAGMTEAERFAKVDLKEIQMEQAKVEEPEVPLDQLPKPEQKPPEPIKEDTPKEQPKPTKPEKVKPERNAKPSKEKGSGGGDSGGDAGGGVGMLAALGNLSNKAPATNIVAAVTNLDAVRDPSGKARFKVSGVVTKLPTSDVVMSRGSGVGTKLDIDLLRGGKGKGGMAGIGPGALTGGSTGKRSVGGVVFKAPTRTIGVRGQLSREEIQKVVAQHLREIQYCYEKNLLLNPNLSGKVIMEWTIALSGSVSIVKTATSTMQTPAVAMCISASISKWVFPAPRGGTVVVTYPFIFNQVGF